MRARLIGTALSVTSAAVLLATAAPSHAVPTGALVVTATTDSPVVTGVKGQQYIAYNQDTVTHTLTGPTTISIAPSSGVYTMPQAGTYVDSINGARVAFVVVG